MSANLTEGPDFRVRKQSENSRQVLAVFKCQATMLSKRHPTRVHDDSDSDDDAHVSRRVRLKRSGSSCETALGAPRAPLALREAAALGLSALRATAPAAARAREVSLAPKIAFIRWSVAPAAAAAAVAPAAAAPPPLVSAECDALRAELLRSRARLAILDPPADPSAAFRPLTSSPSQQQQHETPPETPASRGTPRRAARQWREDPYQDSDSESDDEP